MADDDQKENPETKTWWRI